MMDQPSTLPSQGARVRAAMHNATPMISMVAVFTMGSENNPPVSSRSRMTSCPDLIEETCSGHVASIAILFRDGSNVCTSVDAWTAVYVSAASADAFSCFGRVASLALSRGAASSASSSLPTVKGMFSTSSSLDSGAGVSEGSILSASVSEMIWRPPTRRLKS